MPNKLNTDQERNSLAYKVALCFEVQQIPLVIASKRDQESFVPWMANLVGGRVITCNDAYPLTQFLDSLDHLDYVFLRLEGEVPDDLYLLARDYALNREQDLITKLGSYKIHTDHRLVVFTDSQTLARLADDLREVLQKVCLLKYVSSDEPSERAHQKRQPRVFDSVEDALAWCDRFYANGHFFFRGQTQDWPLQAPIYRVSKDSDREREIERTDNFVDWLINDNPLIDGIKLSEDEAMAVAQHHGLKTGLLDVSRNPRIAAFFATHGADLEINQPGTLYIFHEGDLRKYMNLDGELGNRMGRGIMKPTIEPLRRIRHQQGLFFESRPWLINDLLLLKLSFRQKPRGVGIDERFAPTREFIYPPLSSFERVVENYLLIEEAIGNAERGYGEAFPPPDPSFDATGLYVRALFDEFTQKPFISDRNVYQQLDVYVGLLSLTCSHLLISQSYYLSVLLHAGKLLRDNSLTPELFREVKNSLCEIQKHLSKGQSTKIEAMPHLSIRDLVDGLAAYHAIRSGNADINPAQFNFLLSSTYPRLSNAYACADHWLGRFAWEAFPIAAAFALSCRNPVGAYLDAVVEIGKHEVSFLTRYKAAKGVQILAQWTGHEPMQVDGILQQLELPVFSSRPIERLDNCRKEHPDEVANLGPFIFRIQNVEVLRDLMPQFTLYKDLKIGVVKHDSDLAKTIYPLLTEFSLFEGLAGLESTMRCPLDECPFHRFRICGRISVIPAHPDVCKHRTNLEETYKLTHRDLEAYISA
jgi:hypothetical protein